jgi:ABC-type branched-subunit amino acid transport system ATPase component
VASPGGGMTLLSVQGVSKRFGGVLAVADCSFAIAAPGIYGLIGPNGAGKTTLFDIIAGRQDADRGIVLLADREIQRLPSYARARLGIARSYQECRVLPELTCLENLLFALRPKNTVAALASVVTRSTAIGDAAREQALRLLRLATIEAYADAPAAALSFGQRRLLEIVAAVIARPSVLLLDEPASGINPRLLDPLAALIRAVQRDLGGVTIVVEHNMDFIMALARHIIVMHQGAVLDQGPPDAIRASPRVIDAYLG